MKKLTIASAVLAATFSISANATSLFQPTDGDVNLLIDLSFAGISIDPGLHLSMIDDGTDVTLAPHIDISENTIVGIAGPSGGNYIASNLSTGGVAQVLTLTGGTTFDLVLADAAHANVFTHGAITDQGGNTLLIDFTDGSGNTLAVDIETVSAVPLPAAVWLFGAGLMGLVGVARRKA